MAFAFWAHLDHREMRALAFMANTALDADTPPVYFGGWEALAAALGCDVEAKPENARRTAVRALSALAQAGPIISSGQARTGVRAEYALALDPSVTYEPIGQGRNVKWKKVEIKPEPETATGTQGETATGLNLRQLRVPQGTTSGTTEEHSKEKTEEYTQSFSQLTTARANEKSLDDEPLTTEQDRQRQLAELEAMMQNEGKTA